MESFRPSIPSALHDRRSDRHTRGTSGAGGVEPRHSRVSDVLTDRAFQVDQPDAYSAWLKKLSASANVEVVRLRDLLDALSQRHQAFHDVGGRLSDHGLTRCLSEDCTEQEAGAIFEKAVGQHPVTAEERATFGSFLMIFFGQLDAAKGWKATAPRRNSEQFRSAAQSRFRSGHRLRFDW